MYQFELSDLDLMVDVPWNAAVKNILIAGGTGFVGHALVEALIHAQDKNNNKFQITIVTRKSQPDLALIFSKSILDQIEWVHPQEFSNFKNREFDLFFHLATDVNLFKLNPEQATIEMMAFDQALAQVSGVKFHKIFLLSTGSVYQNSENPTEDSAPISDLVSKSYGVFKYNQEKFWQNYSLMKSCNMVMGRSFSIVGPGVNTSLAVYHFIQNAIHGKPIVLRDTQELRSYIYVADLVRSIFLIALNQNQQACYNLGSDEVINFLQLAQLIKKQVSGTRCEIVIDPQLQVQALSNKYFYPNIDRIKKEFHFQTQVSIEQALAKTVLFYQKWIP